MEKTGNRERHHCNCDFYSNCDFFREMHKSDQRSNEDVDSGVIVLGVGIHCQGCEYSLRKYLWNLDGVESVEIDAEKNIAKVKGKRVDATKIAEKLRKKTGKMVRVISPKPSEKKKEDEKDQPKKEPVFVEVQLKLYLHCPGCTKVVKRCLSKFPGVQTVQLDMEKNLCTVKGTFNTIKLVEYVEECTGKKAEIVKKKEQDDKQHQQQESWKKCISDSAYHTCCLDYLSELCSEENANSCIVM